MVTTSMGFSNEQVNIGVLVSTAKFYGPDTVTMSITSLDGYKIACLNLNEKQVAAVIDLLTNTLPHLKSKEDQYRDQATVERG